jgi:hypothetical protein
MCSTRAHWIAMTSGLVAAGSGSACSWSCLLESESKLNPTCPCFEFRSKHRSIEARYLLKKIALKYVRRITMTMITVFQSFYQLYFVLSMFIISYSRQVQVISPLQSRSRLSVHWVWIIRLIDEIILLSAILPILLASYWGYIGQRTAIDAAMMNP